MKIEVFEMERMQSTWENVVEYDLSESGVLPVSLRELVEMGFDLDWALDTPLTYSQGNGTPELREALSRLYPGAGIDDIEVVVAAEDARFCEVFSKVGGCPDTGSSWLLQQRVGAGIARMLILTGREISGKKAHQMRVVEECVPADQTEATAIALATEMAANPMFGMESCKRVMREVGQNMPKSRPALELNADHPAVARVKQAFEDDAEGALFGDLSELLYGQAVLAEGRLPDDPARFGRLVAELMVGAS